MSREERRAMIEPSHPKLSLSRQCRLLRVSRSSVYHRPKEESAENLALMRRIDDLFLKHPFYGSRQMARQLRREGIRVGRHRVRRLMRLMGLQAIYQAPRTTRGSQFTSLEFTSVVKDADIAISMDGRDRCMDNIFIERLWRSLKYEAVYLHELADGFQAQRLISCWVAFYNSERPHSALAGFTPAEALRRGNADAETGPAPQLAGLSAPSTGTAGRVK